jgi:hypothetical protein
MKFYISSKGLALKSPLLTFVSYQSGNDEKYKNGVGYLRIANRVLINNH